MIILGHWGNLIPREIEKKLGSSMFPGPTPGSQHVPGVYAQKPSSFASMQDNPKVHSQLLVGLGRSETSPENAPLLGLSPSLS